MKKDIIELNQKEILAISGGKDGDESCWNLSAYLREAGSATFFFAFGWFLHRFYLNKKQRAESVEESKRLFQNTLKTD